MTAHKEKLIFYIYLCYNVKAQVILLSILFGLNKSFHMASSSATQPQVFINFRGAELRNGFIAFLEPAMREANINVFIDALEVKGTDLENLLVRIEESRVALAIFSKDYTNSEWCLDELVKIKECKDKGSLKVIPIFYKLDPSVVEYLEGSFGDNFRKMKRNHQHELEKTQKWEEALTSMTKTIGMCLAEQRFVFDPSLFY